MHSLLSWWNSLETISTLSTVAKITGAVVGVMILIVGFRESTLRSRAQAIEKGKWNQELTDARTRAEEAIRGQQWRHIPQDKWSSLTESSRNLPKGSFSIEYPSNDPEAVNFASDIRNMLVAFGFTIENELQLFDAPTDEGMGMLLHSKEQQPAHASTIFQIMRGVDPNFFAYERPRIPVGAVVIRVGHKPRSSK